MDPLHQLSYIGAHCAPGNDSTFGPVFQINLLACRTVIRGICELFFLSEDLSVQANQPLRTTYARNASTALWSNLTQSSRCLIVLDQRSGAARLRGDRCSSSSSFSCAEAVRSLRLPMDTKSYSIDIFKDRHENIDTISSAYCFTRHWEPASKGTGNGVFPE